MEAIKNNPFRILGLPVTASERDISKRIKEISTFAEFGRPIEHDTDFEFISPFDRTSEAIEEASKAIELPENRLFHSLFWFWRGNSIDELVFDFLKDGNVHKAIELWKKSLASQGISDKNISNARNLGLLYLILSNQKGRFNLDVLVSSLKLLGTSNNTKFLANYVNLVTKNSTNSLTQKAQEYYVDNVIQYSSKYIEFTYGDKIKQIADAIKESSEECYKYALNKFINKPVYEVGSEIERAEKVRQAEPEKSYDAAKQMASTVKDSLSFIKSVLGASNIQYQLLADKVANELLLSSTSYYNVRIKVDDSIDPHTKAKQLTLLAKQIAVGDQVKENIENDLKLIDELIEDHKGTQKRLKVKNNFEILERLLKSIDDKAKSPRMNLNNLINEARRLIEDSRSHLQAIKEHLGVRDQAYIGISNAIAMTAFGICIDYANELNQYKIPLEVMGLISKLDISDEHRKRFNDNYKIITQNQAQADAGKNIENIVKQLDKIKNGDSTFTLIEQAFNSCKNELSILSGKGTSAREAYSEWSNIVARVFTNELIEYCNRTSRYTDALRILKAIQSMSMDPDTKTYLNKNLSIIESNIKLATQHASSSKGGCYIATMVYGSYEAPEVLILRNFRDELLSSTYLGRQFIKCYYGVSPCLIRLLCNRKSVHGAIRSLLEILIKVVNK